MTEMHLRPSSFTTYADCARRWAAAHMAAEIGAAGYSLRSLGRNIGAATGTATHAGSTWALETKMQTGTLGALAEAEDRGVASLEEEIAHGADWDEVTPDQATAKRQVARQTRTFLTNVGSRMQPAMVERRLEARRPTGVVVSGQVDIVIDIDATLNDIKTGKRQRNNAVQYGTYSRLLRAHGKPVLGLLEHYVPRVSLKRDQPPPVTVPYEIGPAERAAENVMRRIERDVAEFRAALEPEAFIANPASALCSDRFCPAWGTAFCAHWKKD